MIADLIGRWLRARDAAVDPSPAGPRVTLADGDPLRATLGDSFLLVPLEPAAPVPPGVEPLFPGCRIADLLAADLGGTRGVAVAAGMPPGEGPRFVYSYVAVYSADRRGEGLIRVALAPDSSPTPLPAEPSPPLRTAGDAAAWREDVARLLPAAGEEARLAATAEAVRIEREAQVRLYRAVRRLATVYQQRRVEAAQEGENELRAEFRRLVEAEVDRHRLTVTLTLLGVTVYL